MYILKLTVEVLMCRYVLTTVIADVSYCFRQLFLEDVTGNMLGVLLDNRSIT